MEKQCSRCVHIELDYNGNFHCLKGAFGKYSGCPGEIHGLCKMPDYQHHKCPIDKNEQFLD